MTIASETVASSGSTGNGVTTVFSFSFSLAAYGATTAASQIEVIKQTISSGVETILTLTTDYSVSVNGDQTASPGGSTTLVSAPSSSYKIWIRLKPDYTQQTDLANGSAFNAQVVEDQFDQFTRQLLLLQDKVRRAPYFSTPAGASFSGKITGPFTPGYGIIVNNAGTGFTLGATTSATVSAAMAPVMSSATLALGRTAFGLGTGDTVQFDKFYGGDPTLFGYSAPLVAQFSFNTGSTAPTTLETGVRIVGASKGDNAHVYGSTSLYVEARDRTDVNTSNNGVLYGIRVSVVPATLRDNVPYDDVTGITIENQTGVAGARATDALWFPNNSNVFPSDSEWYALISSNAHAEVGFNMAGRFNTYAMDFKSATIVSGVLLRMPNATYIKARDAADASDRTLIGLAADDSVQIATGTARTDVQSPMRVLNSQTLSAGIGDGVKGITLTPTYTGAFTVDRHSYISLATPTLVSSAVVTNACVFHFDAAAGTHKAVDGSSTKTTPGGVDAWLKYNINGTVYYSPAYTSKTA